MGNKIVVSPEVVSILGKQDASLVFARNMEETGRQTTESRQAVMDSLAGATSIDQVQIMAARKEGMVDPWMRGDPWCQDPWTKKKRY